MLSRINKLREQMQLQNLDAMFISNAVNRRYLTGFTGSAGYVIMTMDKAYLLTDFRYREQAPKQAPAYEVIEHEADVLKTAAEIFANNGVKRAGFEAEHIVWDTWSKMNAQVDFVEWVPAAKLVSQIRLVKDDEEIAVLKAACELADKAFAHILNYIKPGVSEKAIDLELEFFMRKNGADSSSFETIVASGVRSSLPHGTASDRIIEPNEFVTLDFGAYFNGYCSDITRTVMVGKPEAKHRDIYDIVLDAQKNALQHIKPGMTGKQADQLARDIIAEAGYGDAFGHGTGHGIGLEIHEEPRLSPRGETLLAPGMVVTVEPGIYLPGFGGVRIEDDILITENGIEVLTQAAKDFIILD